MCQFPLFETIAIVDGEIQNLSYHQHRFEQAVQDFFGVTPTFCLADIVRVPAEFSRGLVRCRVDYNATEYQVNFYPYQPKKIAYFKIIHTENLDYHLKYADRKRFDFGENLQEGEWLIINNGWVSDCTIGNLLFFKQGQWFCTEDYLLKGTQLSQLLDQGLVKLAKISQADLSHYEKIMMINALNPFDEQRSLPISAIQP